MKWFWQAFIVVSLVISVLLSGRAALQMPPAMANPTPSPASGLTAASPQPENGTGAETGVYAPQLSSPNETITGTVEDTSATGPSGYYVATFDQQGKTTHYFKGLTDAHGHFHFLIPAGIASFMVFRHFDVHGDPDEGARGIVSSDPLAHVANTLPLPQMPGKEAIVGGLSAYQRTQDIVLQTRGVNPLHANLLLDGSTNDIDTLAASDRCVMGRLQSGVALGRHQLSVRSGAQTTNSVPADIIDVKTTTSGSHHTGGIMTVTLTVDGLPPGDNAVADFEVGGSAVLAKGGDRTTVPVVDDRADVKVRGIHAGEAIFNWQLRVDIPPYYSDTIAEATPYPYYTTSRPPGVTYTPSPVPTPNTNTGHTTSRETETPPPTVEKPPPIRTTTKPPTPTPPPTEEPSTPPTVYPSPTPTPPACEYQETGGWFEPTQGVWQDDPFFPDMEGKQLTRLHDLDPVPHYVAELDMIEGRDTVLFGVNHYEDSGGRVNVNSRNTIVISFETNCTTPVAARLIVTLGQRGPAQHVVIPQVVSIPIQGPRNSYGNMVPFTVNIAAPSGVPAVPFTLVEGGYDMSAELVTMAGEATGLKVVVSGMTVQTHPPTLHFVPMYVFYGRTPPNLPTGPGTTLGTLISNTEKLRADSAAVIPDYYPIAPNSLPTVRERPWYVSWDQIKNNDYWDATKYLAGYILSGGDEDDASIFTNLAVVERFTTAISNWQGFAAFVSGANRMVIVMDKISYDMVMGSPKIVSFNLGNKAVLMQTGVNADTVAHEVAHSIPLPNWNPNPECDLAYHNTGSTGVVPDPYGPGTTANGYAAGERLRLAGKAVRILTDGTIHLMGGFVPVTFKRIYAYTTQCTYWHLTKQMIEPPDPAVTLVRGVIARQGKRFAVQMGPVYNLAGSVDLQPNGRGDWSIVTADANGNTLASYAFTPDWDDENGNPRNAIAFAYRIPTDPRTASISIVGERRHFTLRISSQKPSLVITSPKTQVKLGADGSVRVRWNATVQQGYVPIATVRESDDNGKTYHAAAIEISGNSATVYVDPRVHKHLVEVIVSDYSQSTQAIASFKT